MSRDVYIAIMVAAHKGVGLSLSADEVGALSIDEAVHMAAINGLDDKDWPEHPTCNEPNWKKLNPSRKRRRAADLGTIAPEDRARSFPNGERGNV